MSLEMQTFVPAIDDSCVPRWVARLNTLGMRCEIHPDFSFGTHTGFLPFKIALEKSAHVQLAGTEYLTGFEFYMSDFDLAKELNSMRPKQTVVEKLMRKRQEPVVFASPEIDQQLASCKKVLSFVWGSADTFELRMATLSSTILAELTCGVCSYPADNLWYTSSSEVERALAEAEAYEASLRPKQFKLHKFEKWL